VLPLASGAGPIDVTAYNCLSCVPWLAGSLGRRTRRDHPVPGARRKASERSAPLVWPVDPLGIVRREDYGPTEVGRAVQPRILPNEWSLIGYPDECGSAGPVGCGSRACSSGGGSNVPPSAPEGGLCASRGLPQSDDRVFCIFRVK